MHTLELTAKTTKWVVSGLCMRVYTHPGVDCKNKTTKWVVSGLGAVFIPALSIHGSIYARYNDHAAGAGIVLRMVTLWSHRVTLGVVTQGDAP
eukprot:310491-Amorphochlora_amoeboformis.AAC.1